MRLLAISDLHLGYADNRKAVHELEAHPDDWLLVGGDVGETVQQVEWGLVELAERFAKVFWVPGNHELWSTEPDAPRGDARYRQMVELCRGLGVVTPEDPYQRWPGEGPPTRIVPAFLLYDYSFGPPGMNAAEVVAWAAAGRIRAADERLLHPDPYPSRQAWCAARVAATEARLETILDDRWVVMNHWPLRRDLVRIPRVPRYIPWCGTVWTETWHTRYPIDVVVNGHLHVRATDWRDGVRFEEVALGYPRHWKRERGLGGYLRTILPRPPRPPHGPVKTTWHR